MNKPALCENTIEQWKVKGFIYSRGSNRVSLAVLGLEPSGFGSLTDQLALF